MLFIFSKQSHAESCGNLIKMRALDPTCAKFDNYIVPIWYYANLSRPVQDDKSWLNGSSFSYFSKHLFSFVLMFFDFLYNWCLSGHKAFEETTGEAPQPKRARVESAVLFLHREDLDPDNPTPREQSGDWLSWEKEIALHASALEQC